MTTKYLDLMEKILSAYTTEHICRYFDEVKRDGLTEHGFPRLTSNIGILIANGRREDLMPLFLEMMTFCCSTIPKVKAANDFSVREIICCIREIEKSGKVDKKTVDNWKADLRTIEPKTCYNVFAEAPTDPVRNWALFTGVSEFYRFQMGLGGSMEFIETQIASQLQWLDENGMYKDNAEGEVHQPMVYDLVARGLFMLLLQNGYRGKYYEALDNLLRNTGLLQLNMLSVTGELAFGGRSNQFLHNEAWIAAICEYEAARYHREGDDRQAGIFKWAAQRAIENTKYWLAKSPISHIKNRFPFDSMYGCEGYAYFDKYMITSASFYYAASMVCDDSIAPIEPEETPFVWQTSPHFHKIFAKAGGYALEFDTNADPHYDASGLGRVHKMGAPSPICMSLPCPAHPNINLFGAEVMAASLCPGIGHEGKLLWSADEQCAYEVNCRETEGSAVVNLACSFPEGSVIQTEYTLSADGIDIVNRGKGKMYYMLPAFDFDGETHTEITCGETELAVSYEGWTCRYRTDGKILDSGKTAANRNGHYRVFYAEGTDQLTVKIEITK